MQRIKVTTVIETIYEVPDGVSIERIRHLALPELWDAEEKTNEVLYAHEGALGVAYFGTQECLRQSVEHSVTED